MSTEFSEDTNIHPDDASATGPVTGEFEARYGDADADSPPSEDELDPVFEALFRLLGARGPRITLTELAQAADVPHRELAYHFSSVEDVVVAFITDMFERADRSVRSVDGFDSFTLAEKMHALLESILEQLEPHRELLPRMTLRLGATSLMRPRYRSELRRRYASIIGEYFHEAAQANQIPDVALDSPIIRSFADHASTVIAFWLRDKSPNHQATTEFIDQSLQVAIPAAVSTARLLSLGGFFRRQAQAFVSRQTRDDQPGIRPLGARPVDIRHRFAR